MAEVLPPIGAVVIAVDLVSQASLNGQRGKVLSHQVPANPAGISCAVVQFDGQPPLALKAKNLQVAGAERRFAIGDMIEAHSLKNNVALNGVAGKVLTVEESNGTAVYTIEFPPPHSVVALGAKNAREAQKPGAARYPVDAQVRAHGLVSQTAVNGQVGRVIHVQGPDTVVCKFPPPHGTLALKMKNLEVFTGDAVPVPAPAAAPAAPLGAAPAAAAAPAPAAAAATPAATGDTQAQQQFPVASEVEAQGIQSRPDMNGAQGTVMGHRVGPDGNMQVIVRFQVHGTVALLRSNLKALSTNTLAQEFPVGTMVRAHSMQHNVSLEGAVGRVISCDEQAGKVMVLFSHNFGMVSLKRSNCQRADETVAVSDPRKEDMQKALNSLRAPQVPPVIQEGFLNKKTPAMGREYDRRWFVLRGNNLIYYEEKGRIPLSAQHAVQEAPNDTFTVNGPGMSRTFELKADTIAAKLSWVGAIDRVVKGTTEVANCMQQLDALESSARYTVESDFAFTYPLPPKGGPKPNAAEPSSDAAAPAAPAGGAMKDLVAELESQVAQLRERATMAEESKDAVTQALREAQDIQNGASASPELQLENTSLKARIAELESSVAAEQTRAQEAAARAASEHDAAMAALRQQLDAARAAPVAAAVVATPTPTPAAAVVENVHDAVPAANDEDPVTVIRQEPPAAVVPEVAAPVAAPVPVPEPVPAAAPMEFEMVADDDEVVAPVNEATPEALPVPVVADEAAPAPAEDDMFLLAD